MVRFLTRQILSGPDSGTTQTEPIGYPNGPLERFTKMKILHLIDPTCGLDSLDTLVLLLKQLPAEHHVMVLGNYGWRDAALQAGVDPGQLSWSRGLARWDPTLLRNVSRCVGNFTPTHIHAWGSWGIRAASRLAVDLPRIAGVQIAPKKVLVRSLARSAARCPMLFVTPWKVTLQTLSAAGIPKERILKVSAATWIAPNESPAPANLRRILGQPAREGPVVLLTGWSEQAMRHDLGIWAVGILSQVYLDIWALLRSDHIFRHESVNPFAGYMSFSKTVKDPGLVSIAPSNKFSWGQLTALASVVGFPVGESTGLNCVLAAMAQGKAIAAFNTPQIRELLSDRVNALLAPVGDPKELASRLHALLKDNQLRESIGNAARSHYDQYCSPEVFIEQMASVYAQIQSDPALTRQIVLPAEAQLLSGQDD